MYTKFVQEYTLWNTEEYEKHDDEDILKYRRERRLEQVINCINMFPDLRVLSAYGATYNFPSDGSPVNASRDLDVSDLWKQEVWNDSSHFDLPSSWPIKKEFALDLQLEKWDFIESESRLLEALARGTRPFDLPLHSFNIHDVTSLTSFTTAIDQAYALKRTSLPASATIVHQDCLTHHDLAGFSMSRTVYADSS